MRWSLLLAIQVSCTHEFGGAGGQPTAQNTAPASGTSSSSTSAAISAAATTTGCSTCLAAPAGFLWVFAPGASCSAPAYEGFAGVQAPPAECQCGCGEAKCELPAKTGSDFCLLDVTITEECTNIFPTTSFGQPVNSGCAPSQVSVLPAVKMESPVDVCPLNSGTCPDGQVSCGDSASACLAGPGDLQCPATHPTRQGYFRSVNDSRACAPCACAAAPCFGSVELWSGAAGGTCFGAVVGTIAPDERCTFRNAWGAKYVATSSCQASAPTAIGGVAGADPLTICCP